MYSYVKTIKNDYKVKSSGKYEKTRNKLLPSIQYFKVYKSNF